MLKRSLLHLLGKLIPLLEEAVLPLQMPSLFHKRLSIIRKVLKQQQIRFQSGEVSGLIVSIDKSYIRPIVRGKETKQVVNHKKVLFTPTGSEVASHAMSGCEGMFVFSLVKFQP